MQAQSLSELFVECGSANVLTLAEEQLSYEGMLSIENPDHDILKKPVVHHSHFTKKRKIIFLAKGYKYLYKLVLHIIYVITLCTGILLLKINGFIQHGWYEINAQELCALLTC